MKIAHIGKTENAFNILPLVLNPALFLNRNYVRIIMRSKRININTANCIKLQHCSTASFIYSEGQTPDGPLALLPISKAYWPVEGGHGRLLIIIIIIIRQKERTCVLGSGDGLGSPYSPVGKNGKLSFPQMKQQLTL